MPQQYMVSMTAFIILFVLNSLLLISSTPAWAHLILYGEEATRQAQKEGEEAAAAYEQEKKDIAEGKIPAASTKPEKKKRQGAKKKADGKDDDEVEGETKTGRKRGRAAKDDAGGDKKRRASADKESLAPILAKSIGKVRYGIFVSVIESTHTS